MIEFVTIEFYDRCWHAILWGADLVVIAKGAGVSPQAALQNATGVARRLVA